MSPPERAAAPAGTGAADRSADQAARQGTEYPHDPARCVTCSGVQHRDVIADAWLNWGRTYGWTLTTARPVKVREITDEEYEEANFQILVDAVIAEIERRRAAA